MRDRPRAVGAFYRSESSDLFRAVRRAITGPTELVEDACAHAWSVLLQHDEVSLDRGGFARLYVVAIREAYRLSDRSRREWPAGSADEVPRPRTTPVLDSW